MENNDFSNLNENENKMIVFVMHEIHASLNSIVSKLSYLSKKDPSKREDQEIIKEGILDASCYADTIRMFLDYFQLSADPNAYFAGAKMKPQDLWRTFYYPNEYFKNFMRKKGIKHKVEKIDDRIPLIEAFPIIHAISNILWDNAIKYSPNGAEIFCTFEIEGDDLIITMENTGPYLDEEDLKNLFKKGFRGKNATKKDIRGHGYGMDFLKQIVDAHDGHIKIKSSNDSLLDGIPHGEFKCILSLPIE